MRKSKHLKIAAEEMLILGYLLIAAFFVRYAMVPLTSVENGIHKTNFFYDAFNHGRATLLLFTGILVAVIFGSSLLTGSKKIIKDRFTELFIAFAGIAALATLFSPVRELALKGAQDSYQGLWVILCYVLLAVIISTPSVKSKDEMGHLISKYTVLCAAVLILSGLVSILQYLGNNPFEWPGVRNLMAPSSLLGNEKLFLSNGMAYAFFGNPNYISSAVVLLIPFVVHGFIKSQGTARTIYLIAGVFGQIALLASCSLSGILLAPIVYFLLFLWYMSSKETYKRCLYFMAGIGTTTLAFLGIPHQILDKREVVFSLVAWTLVFAGGWLIHKLTQTKPQGKILLMIVALGILYASVTGYQYISHKTDPGIDLVIREGVIQATFENTSVNISARAGSLEFKNSEGQLLETTEQNGIIKFRAPKYQKFEVEKIKINATQTMTLKPFGARFFVLDNELRYMDNSRTENTIDEPSYVGSKSTFTLGTGRGYIWQHVLPLIAKKPVLGYGPDTLVAVFPQNDPASKYLVYQTPYMTVDKPHSLYLQYLFNYGLSGLVAFGALMAIVLKKLYELIWTKNEEEYGLPIFTALVGYLAVGLVNDDHVFTASFVWVLLGLAVRLIRTQAISIKQENQAAK